MKHHRPLLALATTLALSTTLPSLAGSGGPDGYGYSWIDNAGGGGPNYVWVTPTSDATTILSGNAVAAGTIDLEVPWGGIYGEIVSQLRVSRNGFLSSEITDPGGDETNDCPLPATPSQGGGNRLYVLHDNLEIDNANGKIFYEYFPESPHSANSCGVHVITWSNVHHPSPDATRFSFQALLFDNLDILFQYGPGNPESGLGSTTGIQNAAATLGLTVTCDAKEIPDDYAILIRPPVLTVTTEVDENDATASDGAGISLREAIRDAASGTRIEFAAALDADKIDLSTPGGGVGSRITIAGKALALDASALGKSITISGGGGVRHFFVNTGAWLSLNNLRLADGFIANGSNSGSTFVDNSSTLVACDCSWEDNVTNLTDGGAIQVESSSIGRFYRCDFFRNRAGSEGGALSGRSSASLTAEKCRFYRNTATFAGGISLRSCTADLRYCEFSMNESGTTGGGIVMNVGVIANLHGCTFDSCRAAASGGAIAIENNATATATPAIAVFSRCTFFENIAAFNGGAIHESSTNNSGDTAELHFSHCTIYKNKAGVLGGGFHLVNGRPTLTGTCLAANTAGVAAQNFAASGTGSLSSLGENLESGTEAGFTQSFDQQNTDPQLTDLGYFGGFVRTCLPVENSPLIDAAQDSGGAFYPDARGIGLADRDGNGDASPADDIGAVELGPPVLVTNDLESGPGSLTSALGTVSDGGTVRFSGVSKITLPTSTTITLSVPSGKNIFIDGTGAGRLALENASLFLFDGQNIGMHRLDLSASPGNSFYTRLQTFSDASMTLHDCCLDGMSDPSMPLSQITAGTGSRLTIARCRIANNRAQTAQIELQLDVTSFIRDTLVWCNESASRGTISVSSGTLFLQRSSIVGNVNKSDFIVSGILSASTNSGRFAWLEAENTTVSENTATEMGAGIRFFADGNAGGISGRLRNCTVLNNQGVQFFEAGITSNITSGKGELRVENCVVAGNLPQDFRGGSVSGGGNLSATTIPGALGTDIQNTDPLLSELVNGTNGTLHHVPRPGSPCLDAGVVLFSGTTDGRGTLRYINADGLNNSEPDIGAVESGRVLTVTTATDENNGLGSGAGNSLRECLAEAQTYGAVNLQFDPLLNGTTFVQTSSLITLSGITADLDARDSDITLEFNILGGFPIFKLEEDTAFSATGLTFDAPSTICLAEANAACTLDRSGLVSGTFVFAIDQSQARITNTAIHDLDLNVSAIAARNTATLTVSNVSFTDNRTGPGNFSAFVSTGNSVDAKLVKTTMARNAMANRLLIVNQSARMLLDRCTFARNGAGISTQSATTLTLRNTILTNGAGSSFYSGAGTIRSLGGNLSELDFPAFDPALGDLDNRCTFLAPLADYNGDGLREMPPLAISPAFNREVGASAPPSEVLVVTTELDQLDFPSGLELSLQEAIRDLAPGGAIVFDPALNDATLSGNFSINKDLAIDATSLPHGIDIIGRTFCTTPGATYAVHGVHLRDKTSDSGTGGSLYARNSSLVASHCTFSGNSFGSPSAGGGLAVDNGRLVAESCTFSNNKFEAGSAIYLTSGATGEVSYCTLSESNATSASGGVILLDSASCTVYGSVFDRNAANGAPGPSIELRSGGVFTSLGYNAFPDAPAGTVASDTVNRGDLASNTPVALYSPLDDNGGWVETYLAMPLIGVQDTLPPVTSGAVPPPSIDTRGYARIFGPSADWGATEFGGSILDRDGDGMPDWWEWFYGLNPNDPSDATENPDGDALDNLAEFLAGKNPNVADSTIATAAIIEDISFDGPILDIQWRGTAGELYRFEHSGNLINWTEFGSIKTANGNSQHQLIGPVPQQYWRIRSITP